MSLRDRLLRAERKLALSRSAVASPQPMVVHFAGDTGEVLPCDEAQVDFGQWVTRLPAESQEDFEKRLRSLAPCDRPSSIVMFSTKTHAKTERDSHS